ncbi:MAG TPA: hypothetical protein VKX31_08755 [Brumimicrobium sp.]|nr:hypothetical protein [Brumimicrobium sp.]
MENFEPQYPQKPILVRKKSNRHFSITLFSMVLFALTLSLITDDYVLIFIILGILILHEGGHFLMMKLFNYEELNMLFIPFFGAMVLGRKEKYSQIETALMVIAGPLPGILLGASLLIYQWINPDYVSIQLGVLLIGLNVMNLLPIDPLDGGRLVRTLFFKQYELIQFVFSILSSFAIIGLGLYFNAWIVIGIGFLLGYRIKNKHKLYLIRKEMKKEGIKFDVNYEDLSDKSFSKIKNIIIEHTPILKEIENHREAEDYGFIIAKQVDGVLFPPTKKDATTLFKTLILFLWLGGIVLSIYSFFITDINSIVDAFQGG